MAFIKVTVTGLNEAISFFNTTASQIHQTTQDVLNEAGDVWVKAAKINAHVITGNMKGSIYKNPPSGNSVEVGAKAPYSQIENKRSGGKAGYGPHNFATRATETTTQAILAIIKSNFDRLFKV